MLCSGETGAPLAILDGTMLTVWRTACASALASRYLSRKDASRHGHGRGRSAGTPSHPRPCVDPPHPQRDAVEQVAGEGQALADGLSGTIPGVTVTVATDPAGRSRGCRHRQLRHHLVEPSRLRRLAEARCPSRPCRRLHAGHARGRRRGGQARQPLRRHAHRRPEGGRRYRRPRSGAAS